MAAKAADVAAFKPVLRAYALGYLASAGPRLFEFRKVAKRKDLSFDDKLRMLATILKTPAEPHRFPTAVALIIAGTTTFPRLLLALLRLFPRTSGSGPLSPVLSRRVQYACTFLSAWVAFTLLNRDQTWARKRAHSRGAGGIESPSLRRSTQQQVPLPTNHSRYAGKTIDLTLFAFFRAVDVLVIEAWIGSRSSKWHPERYAPRLAKLLKGIADPVIFAASASAIMWCWMYLPYRLPKAYNNWISAAAETDPRLIQALRLCRQGDIVYGQDTGQAPLLQSLCDELGLPQKWGDPAKAIPIPCELIHCGTGKSCELHAASRFWRSFILSLKLYLPLQLLSKIRRPNKNSVVAALKAATRSSSFLAAFTTLFYYSVCVARSKMPKFISYNTITPQMWDAGLGVLAGCLTCGWSILLENPRQRQELAFFVAPRALATFLPRVYNKDYQRREQLAFALSVTIVLNAVRTAPDQTVRGVFGRILRGVVRD